MLEDYKKDEPAIEKLVKEIEQGKPDNPPHKSQADLLLEIIEATESGIVLFKNELGNPFANIPVESHRETWPIKSRMFKNWLANKYWVTYSKAANSNSISSALGAIEGKACFNGQLNTLYNRVAWRDNELWFDLSDSKWRAVKITTDGWQIIDNPPILFRRLKHQQAQVDPAPQGDVKKFLEFVNISDKGQQLLLLVFLVSCFIPDFPHALAYFFGQQGAAKSMVAKLIKLLVDPSPFKGSGFPKDQNEFVQQLFHHWFVSFDNISNLPDWVSDLLCRAVSGDAFSKRELYSDEDDIIFVFQRVISLNGINLLISKPDLFDRSILFELERIPDKNRKDESLWLKEFEAAKPTILAGVFDVISKAIKIKPTIELLQLPRMADFALWGCAIAEAMGYSKDDFLRVYYKNIKNQNEEIMRTNILADILRIFMADKPNWEGSPSELFEALKTAAGNEKIAFEKETDFPKGAQSLSRKLNVLKTNFAQAGIELKRDDSSNRRKWIIVKSPENSVFTAEASAISPNQDTKDNTDAILPDLHINAAGELETDVI
jgi:hypothetical protein